MWNFLLLFLVCHAPLIASVEYEDIDSDEYILADVESDEDEDNEIPLDGIQAAPRSAVPNQPNNPKPDAPHVQMTTLIDMHSTPSSMVNGCVNVISGNFVENAIDYVVSGPEPLILGHGAIKDRFVPSNMAHGWCWAHPYKISVYQEGSIVYTRKNAKKYVDDASKIYLTLHEPYGQMLFFKGDRLAKKFELITEHTGYVNTAQGEISGKTNYKNIIVQWHAKGDYFEVTLGDGTRRFYQARKKGGKEDTRKEKRSYHIIEERKPSGNKIMYTYEGNKIKKIASYNADESQCLGFAEFHYFKQHIEARTSDEQTIVYHFTKLKTKEKKEALVITQIDIPGKLPRTFNYSSVQHGHDRRLIEISHKDGSYIRPSYWRKSDNTFGDDTIDMRHDKRRHVHKNRVCQLKEPVGVSGSEQLTYRFLYKIFEDIPESMYQYEDERRAAGCIVYDAYDNRSVYTFSKSQRLVKIDHQDAKKNSLMSETFSWGKEKNKGNLMAKALLDESGNVRFARSYTYDSRGNITEEKIFGYLQSESGSLKLDKNGLPSGSCDQAIYRYKYSDDGFNNKIEICDPDKNYVYLEYKPNSSLLTKRLTCFGKSIKKREFFTYDTSGQVIEHIVDDGQSVQQNDIKGVTERHNTRFKRRNMLPHYGEIEEITEYWFDIIQNKEILLNRRAYTFSDKGLVTKEEFFDSENKCIFTKEYEYDSLDRLIKISDSCGRLETFAYDEQSRVILKTGPHKESSYIYTYDQSNRLIKEEEKRGQISLVTRYEYNAKHQLVKFISPQQYKTSYSYDALGRLVEVSSDEISTAYGKVKPKRKITYAKAGTEIIEIDELSQKTYTKLNARGQILEQVYSDGTKRACAYDMMGRLIKEKTPIGYEIHNTYDLFNRILSSKKCAGFWSSTYAEHHYKYSTFHLLEEILPTQERRIYEYDLAGRVVAQKLVGKDKEQLTSFTYDSRGRVEEERQYYNETNSGYIAKKFIYDGLNRVVDEKTCDSNNTVAAHSISSYDSEGNLSSVTRSVMGKNATTTYSYHPAGVPFQVRDPHGETVTTLFDYFAKDRYGQTVVNKTTIDPRGVKVVEYLDPRGLVSHLEVFDPMKVQISAKENVYDASGNLIAIREDAYVDGKKSREIWTKLVYGPMNRQEKVIQAAGTSEEKCTSHQYNKNGQMTATIQADGTKVETIYDAIGRIYTVKGRDFSYTYTYDSSDRVLSILNSSSGAKTEYTYNSIGEVIQEKFENNLSIQYEYDRLGRIRSKKLPNNETVSYSYSVYLDTVEYKNKKYTIKKRDLSGHPLEIELPDTTKIHYEYDLLGNTTKITHPEFKQTLSYDQIGDIISQDINCRAYSDHSMYRYDYLSQLIEEKGKYPHQYRLDSLNAQLNVDGVDYVVNNLHSLLSNGTSQFSYDRNGRRVTKDNNITYLYDSLDRLIKVVTKDDTIEYTYDACSRRMTKSSSKGKELYLYSGDDEIGMSKNNTLSQLRILGEGLGAEIGAAAFFEFDNTLYIPLADHRGNITVLLNSNGAPCQTYRYSAYREEDRYGWNNSSYQEIQNPWRFSSKRLDSETGFIFFGKRYYDPETRQWITQDPLGIKAGPNLYAYGKNNPLTHIDPYGLEEETVRRDHNDTTASDASETTPATDKPMPNSLPETSAQVEKRSFFDKAVDKVKSFIAAVGRVFESIIYNFLPAHGLTHFGTFVREMCGAKPRSNRASGVYVVKDDPGATHTVGLGNGIDTSFEKLKEYLQSFGEFIAEKYSKVKCRIVGVYNKNRGIVKGVLYSICCILGIPNPLKNEAKNNKRELQKIAGNSKVAAIGHSQSAQLFEMAFKETGSVGNKNLSMLTLGGAGCINGDKFGLNKAQNVVHRSDIIPFIASLPDYIGSRFFGSGKMTFTGKSFRNPLKAHDFRNVEYQKAIRDFLGDFFENP